ncbi:MAG: hypothetical protein AAF311_17515, partial [Pseudomonadota bacterium]
MLPGLTESQWRGFVHSFPALPTLRMEYDRLHRYAVEGVPPPKPPDPASFSVQRARALNPALVAFHVGKRLKAGRYVVLPSASLPEVRAHFPIHGNGAHHAPKKGSSEGRFCVDASNADNPTAWTPNMDYSREDADELYGAYSDPDTPAAIRFFFDSGGERGWLIGKSDVKSAFERLPASDALASITAIVTRDYLALPVALPFGHAVCPHAFLNVARVVQAWARTKAPALMKTDDLMVFAASAAACATALDLGEEVIRALLGPAAVNAEKRCEPAHQQELLGWRWDTQAMTLALTEAKQAKARSLLAALSQERVSLETLRSGVGFLRFAATVVLPCRAALTAFNELLPATQRRHRRALVRLPEAAKYAVNPWKLALDNPALWTLNLSQVTWVPRLHDATAFHLQTDASLVGGGGELVIGNARYAAGWLWP